MKSKLLHALSLILWMGVIITFTLQSGEASGNLSGMLTAKLLGIIEYSNLSIDFETLHWIIRKAAHVSEYVVFGLLAFYACKPYTLSFKKQVILVFLLGVMFAGFDEYLQTHIPNRAGQITDVIIDSLGLFKATVLVLLGRYLFRNHHERRTP